MLTERVEALLNRQIGESPRAAVLVAELQGRRVKLDIAHTPWCWTLTSDGRSLHLTRNDDGRVDATLRGTPLSLTALAGRDPEAVIRRGEVTIEGDAELVARFRELAALLRPDLEEGLSRLIGDMPSHQLGLAARAATGWLRSSLRTTVQNAAEYLAHERRDLVPRAEADGFLSDVDRLREDVDRLAARVDALAAHRASP